MPTSDEETEPLGWQASIVIGLMASCAYFCFVYLITRYSYRWSEGFGLFCSLALAFAGLICVTLGYWFIRESRSALKDGVKPILIPFLEKLAKRSLTLDTEKVRRVEITFFFPVVTLFLASWASLAYGFAKLRPAAYAHPEQLSFGLMFWHYLWQIVDMVPLVEAWKHLHIEDPVLENRFWPGILVIIFRLIILFVVLSAAAKLFRLEKRTKLQD